MMCMLLKEIPEPIRQEMYSFIDKHCIFRCKPDFIYHEGAPPGIIYSQYPSLTNNTFQLFMRRFTHDAKMLHYLSAIIVKDIFKKTGEDTFFQLAGLESSSIPIIAGIQEYLSGNKIAVNSFTIRKERKGYGLFNFVEGISTDAPVLLVDDTINSGNSIRQCLEVCNHELNLLPHADMYAIVRFNKNMEHIKYNDSIIEVNYLFDIDEFDLTYDPEKYWHPKDCDKSVNKRPEYI